MKNGLSLALATILIAGLVVLKPGFFSTEKDQIRDLLYKVVKSCEYEESLGLAKISMRLNDLVELFAPDVDLTAVDEENSYTVIGWTHIKDYFLLGSQIAIESDISISGLNIKLDNGQASAEFLAIVDFKDKNEESFREKV